MRILRDACAGALLLAAAAALTFAETSIPLAGDWALHRAADGRGVRADAEWRAVAVPSHLEFDVDLPYAWYRRTFALPEGWRGRHVFLRFGGVKFTSEVYVNGRRVGGHYGGWEPFEVEITDACRFGRDNELLVRAEDVRGIIDGQVSRPPAPDSLRPAVSGALAPMGSETDLFGIWEGVSLLARREVFVREVAVSTSVRQGRIEVRCLLANVGRRPRQVRLRGRVMDGEAAVLEMGGTAAAIPAGADVELTLGSPWPDARLWMPSSPHLYQLVLELADAEGGDLDARRVRFGFREVWVEGTRFMLNGRPMSL
ncbi:MAG: sugar-binding domain-containing protein, partial [Planctomycetota bacterium]